MVYGLSLYALDRSERWRNGAGGIVLVSEHLQNVPEGMRARYTYEHPSENEYRELFELDMGRGFETYVSNRFVRSTASNN